MPEDKKPRIKVLVGRTASGFYRFLEERGLAKIEEDALADYVLKTIQSYEKGDEEGSTRLLCEIWDVVGVKDFETALEVARQFARLCDTYRTLFQSLTGKENITEDLTPT